MSPEDFKLEISIQRELAWLLCKLDILSGNERSDLFINSAKRTLSKQVRETTYD